MIDFCITLGFIIKNGNTYSGTNIVMGPNANIGSVTQNIHSKEKPLDNQSLVSEHEVKRKILVVFANPKGSSQLRLDEEDRTIRECIKLSKRRDNLHLEIRHAVRIPDLRRLLLEDEYQIIHFSGHGASSGAFALEDVTGNIALVPPEALANFLSGFESIECVLLNACYSVDQGKLISMGVPFTIGMEGPISDIAAKYFTEGFYDAIGAGHPYSRAYKIGCDSIALQGYSEASTPVFLSKSE